MRVGNLLERVLKQFSVKLCEIKVECNTYNEVYYKVMLFKGFRHVETYFVQLNTSVFANLVCVRAFQNHVQSTESTGRLQSSCRNDVLEQTKP